MCVTHIKLSKLKGHLTPPLPSLILSPSTSLSTLSPCGPTHTHSHTHAYVHRTYIRTDFLLFFPANMLRWLIYNILPQQRSPRMQNASRRCQARHCGLSYLMWKGVVNVICMLRWCSNSSVNASSAMEDCYCMADEQTSVSDDICAGPLCCPGWATHFCTMKTSLSSHVSVCRRCSMCVQPLQPRACRALWQWYVKYLILQS